MRKAMPVSDGMMFTKQGDENMPDLFIPEGEEREFHKQMLGKKASVNGIRILSEMDPAGWQDHWTDTDASEYCYRLIYCSGCGYFVGDTAYRKTGEGVADLWLMIDGDMRREGYGAAVLKQIAEEARAHGILTLRIVLPEDHPDLPFFQNRYFKQTGRTDSELILQADTADLIECECVEDVCSLNDHS